MNNELVTTFFALILLATSALVIIALIVPSLRLVLRQVGIYAAAAVAIGAMLGSLYLSGIAHFTPCRLCWYQRIAMYPLALILPISIATHDKGVRRYAYPLAIIGAIIAIYHVQLQIFPENDAFCPPEGGCTGIFVQALGFMTIPQMALISFLLILAFLWASRPRKADEVTAPAEDDATAAKAVNASAKADKGSAKADKGSAKADKGSAKADKGSAKADKAPAQADSSSK